VDAIEVVFTNVRALRVQGFGAPPAAPGRSEDTGPLFIVLWTAKSSGRLVLARSMAKQDYLSPRTFLLAL